MYDMSDDEFTVDELVACCQTQARLLHGRVETLDEETTALLSEIDDDLSDVWSQLDGHAGVDRAYSPTGPDGDQRGAGGPRSAGSRGNGAVVTAKQTRRDAFESLAVEYLGLADRLRSNTPAPSVALKRVIQVEHDHDAPAASTSR